MSTVLAENRTRDDDALSENPEAFVLPYDPKELELEEHYEIIDGVKQEMPPMSADAQLMAFELAYQLSHFARQHNLGTVSTEVLIKLPLPVDRNRRPDACFIPVSRWPRSKPVPIKNAWEVLPSLCIEVISPYDLATELVVKTEEYLQSGVDQVWLIYPEHERVFVFTPPMQCRVLNRDDTLDGGTTIPGFRLPLAELFLRDESPST